GDDGLEKRVQRFSTNPGLNPEPAARDQRAHQGGYVRAERAVRRTREHRKRDAVLRAWMRIQEDGDEDDRVAEEDGEERLPPVHAGRDEPGCQHVGGDAMGHADPQRGVGVRGPRAPGKRDRREIVVIERTRFDARRTDELYATIRETAFVHRRGDYIGESTRPLMEAQPY